MIEKTNLPKGWEVKKLGEVCLKVQTVKRKEKKLDEELLYLDIGGIDNLNNVVLSHKNFIWENAPSRAQQIVHLDDILFSTVRTYMKNIAIVNNQIYDGQIASSGFCVIRANKEIINPKLIFYYSLSHKFLQPLNELQTGSSYPAIRDKDVFSQPFPYPPLSEQTAIVAKIEELLSDLENGKQQLLTAQAQLKVYRQSLLKWAFEGKLTNKNIREGELPEGWTKSNLRELKKFSLYGPRFSSDDYNGDGNVAILRTTDINESGKVNWIKAPKLNLSDKDYEKYKLLKGDLLITRTGSIGTISIFNDDKRAIAGAFLIYYRLKETVNIKYIFYFLKSSKAQTHFKKASAGVGRPNLNVPNIELLSIPLPTFAEQTRIVEELESKLTVCDKIEETISQSLAQSEILRQSILKKAFEGKLV